MTGAVRIDAGVREGDAISPYYDSMIAKLIVLGRTTASRRWRGSTQALAQTHIVGLRTNVQFLRRVVRSRSFAQADLDTGADRARARGAVRPGAALACRLAAARRGRARAGCTRAALRGADPCRRRDGWRLHGVRAAALRHSSSAASAGHARRWRDLHDGALQLTVGDAPGRCGFVARRRPAST